MADLAIDPRMELNPPLVTSGATYAEVTDQISALTETTARNMCQSSSFDFCSAVSP